MMADKKRSMNYCVLYTHVLKQERLKKILKRDMPEGRGTVFYPCVETYRRDRGGEIEIRALFPGYVFIRSDMKTTELHEFVRSHSREMQSYIRELRFSEALLSDDPYYEEDYMVSDLTEKETEFMDFLLGADGADDTDSGSRDSQKDEAAPEGLLKMSFGYKEGKKKYRVMKGPLKAYEQHIRDVSVRDRRAWLDFEIKGRVVSAGFEVKPKKFWFPDDVETPEVLADGTELDIKELVRSMTRI